MPLHVREAGLAEIELLRDAHRREAECQIVRYSILPRGLADPFLVLDGSSSIGYAGIWNRHFPGRLLEFFVVREHRARAGECLDAVLAHTGAGTAESQTNLPLDAWIRPRIGEPVTEKLLFREGAGSARTRPDLTFRLRTGQDAGPEGEWVVERDGEVVGGGGLLHHYNPPYADLFMEVVPAARGRGVGSFLVQELRRVARQGGGIPAARCDPANEASRRALLRGGLVQCGEIVAGAVDDTQGSENRGPTRAESGSGRRGGR